MNKPRQEDRRPHRGITFHAMPVAGAGGAFLTIGVVLMFVIGVPSGKWFVIASVLAGLIVLGIIRLVHRFRPTEEEEIQLNIGHPTRKS